MSWAKVTAGSLRPSWWCWLAGSDLCVCVCGFVCACTYMCAAALSSCAHVKELVRTKQGPFTLQEHVLHEQQWTLENILQALRPTPHAQNQQNPTPKEQPGPE